MNLLLIAAGPGAVTAKMVSLATKLTSKNVEAAAANQLPPNLQGALMAGEDDNPLFLGGLRPGAADAVTDAMGAAIATGVPASLSPCSHMLHPIMATGQLCSMRIWLGCFFNAICNCCY